VWEAQDVLPYVPDIEWPDQISGKSRPADQYWVRVWTRQNSDKARSIGRPALYFVNGFMYIQIFSPLTTDKGAGKNLSLLAQTVKDGYTSKTVNGVDIVSVLIREMTSETKWHSKRVAVEYQFDYLK
jgi:hypothetical protein